MKSHLAALGLIATLLSQAAADGVRDSSEDRLSLTIVPNKDRSGSSVIDRQGVFSVLLENRSAQPIKVWAEHCQLGHASLSFRVEDETHRPWLMEKAPQQPWEWKNVALKTITIAPGATYAWKVTPSSFWQGDYEWKGVPEPNTGKAVSLRALFEIKPSKPAQEQGVWTGRVMSEPIATLIIDPQLQTPHEYLRARCPKQALRLMQGNRQWVNQTDDDQRTPLHVAAAFGFREVVGWMLAHGADVNARAGGEVTPLHCAEDPEMVKLLLAHKADVYAKNGSDRTALEEAASLYASFAQDPDSSKERDRWRSITKILLDAGAEYDLRSACYLNDAERVRVLVADRNQALDKEAMRMAATYGRAQIVKLLLDHGADPEDADYGGLTVSYFALAYPDVLKLLFDAGANPKVTVDYQGSGRGPQGTTLLHEAAERGFVESARLLCTKGLGVNAPDSRGVTPLYCACRGGHVAMVEYLLKNKANPRPDPSGGWTPMAAAAREIRPEHDDDNARYQAVIRLLERAGAEVDLFTAIACDDVRRVAGILRTSPKAAASKDRDGLPALHRAVKLDRREIVKLLLDRGCPPDVRSEATGCLGETALMEAAFWNRTGIAELLIQHGAKVSAKADGGVTPLREAARMRCLDIAQLLLKHGADVNAQDNQGKTPLDWASDFGDFPEMTKLLRSHGGRGKDAKP